MAAFGACPPGNCRAAAEPCAGDRNAVWRTVGRSEMLLSVAKFAILTGSHEGVPQHKQVEIHEYVGPLFLVRSSSYFTGRDDAGRHCSGR